MHCSVTIRLLQSDYLDLAYSITRDAYSLNFAHHWEEGGLSTYLDLVFGREVLAVELGNSSIQYYVAFVDDKPAAFMKLNLNSNLPGLAPEMGIELEKLYVLPAFKGVGIGRLFLAQAIRVVKEQEKEVFWLAVLDKNDQGIAFYEKAGFRKHSKMQVHYPKFKEELKGMWRMIMPIQK
jgi:ribosomal protein S18 acetylase RimI-like enzyme